MIIFEPFYENYFPDAKISGAVPRYVALHPPDWRFREEELSSAFCDRTRLIIINSPNNPTGRVFTRDELTLISRLCVKYGVIACTDEIYEHIVYDGGSSHPDWAHTRDGGSDRHDQFVVEDLFRYGVACGVGKRTSGANVSGEEGS